MALGGVGEEAASRRWGLCRQERRVLPVHNTPLEDLLIRGGCDFRASRYDRWKGDVRKQRVPPLSTQTLRRRAGVAVRNGANKEGGSCSIKEGGIDQRRKLIGAGLAEDDIAGRNHQVGGFARSVLGD